MDKEKILQQIVKKAEEGGFDMKPYLPAFPNQRIVGKFLQVIYKEFIYTHKFAEAYWGKRTKKEEKYIKQMIQEIELPSDEPIHPWQYYLQKMILKKDHIKYLSKFLKK